MPPANVSPITCSICCATLEKMILRTTAPRMPQKITFVRIDFSTREAAMPTTMALSPASVRSIIRMLNSGTACVRHQCGETR